MRGTHVLRVRNDGRLVIPATLLASRGWEVGTAVIGVETTAGLLLISTDEARSMLREQLQGVDLAAELLAERAEAARRENAGAS